MSAAVSSVFAEIEDGMIRALVGWRMGMWRSEVATNER